MLLNERIREIRKVNNLTAKKFSDIFNISHSSVSLYESGKRTPNIDLIIKIAKHFDVSTDYLLGITDIPYSTTHYSNKQVKFDIPQNIDTIFKHMDFKDMSQSNGIKLDDKIVEILKTSMQKFIETFFYMTHGM